MYSLGTWRDMAHLLSIVPLGIWRDMAHLLSIDSLRTWLIFYVLTHSGLEETRPIFHSLAHPGLEETRFTFYALTYLGLGWVTAHFWLQDSLRPWRDTQRLISNVFDPPEDFGFTSRLDLLGPWRDSSYFTSGLTQDLTRHEQLIFHVWTTPLCTWKDRL